MELGLSLGDASKPFFGFLAKNREIHTTTTRSTTTITSNGIGFCMGLGIKSNGRQEEERERANLDGHESDEALNRRSRNGDQLLSLDPPVQLDLLPLSPVPRITRPSYKGSSEGGSSENMGFQPERGFDVNRLPETTTEAEEEAVGSSPNSAASSFQMDFCIYRGGAVNNKRDLEATGNDVVDEDENENENGLSRKKLRLSKDQSAYLEESFKEHHTLNPKQKLALAKQLNLRPRQVEVWFQNRRARTKLKQTEVDCEYLKRCFETLTEENRRLHKEVHELRVLKSSSNPFHMQLPATTLTMCPSCERVATTSATATATAKPIEPTSKSLPFPLSRPRFSPFSQSQSHPSTHQSAAS